MIERTASRGAVQPMYKTKFVYKNQGKNTSLEKVRAPYLNNAEMERSSLIRLMASPINGAIDNCSIFLAV